MHRVRICAVLVAVLAAAPTIPVPPALATDLPDTATLRTWVEEMKTRERGPFERIRWFCKDGRILPPKPYACGKEGGHQHGEWTERVKRMRANGYYIANVMAGTDGKAFLAEPDHLDAFGQALVEQYLINADDGWIIRQALNYRGAFQEEGEREGGLAILSAMTDRPDWYVGKYLAIMSGARLLPHGQDTASVTKMRQVSAALSDRNPAFKPLRNKIHIRPDPSDAAAVRDFAAGVADPAARQKYLDLAVVIDGVYASRSVVNQLRDIGTVGKKLKPLSDFTLAAAARLEGLSDPSERFIYAGELMADLRDWVDKPKHPVFRLRLFDAILALQDEQFTTAAALRDRMPSATRRQRLDWLAAAMDATYGTGLLSGRQYAALKQTLAQLNDPEVGVKAYKAALDYLALVPGWGSQALKFYFQGSMDRLTAIEPKAALFIQDQLRGSPLFVYAPMLDGLLQDANRLAGVRNELFGADVGAGFRSLNPGLARGRLSLAQTEHQEFSQDGIYLLPETIAELPPVAGILTAGEGNPLSHVQLLARNLGIPNVAVDESLIARLKPYEGRTVILAASPAGSVRISEDTGQWQELFGKNDAKQDVLIRPDLEKLDLEVTDFLPLSRLRATDSGRTVGPKAAKLGELRHAYPEAVADGLTIPFGIFRQLLDQPHPAGGNAFDWMVGEYRRLGGLPAGSDRRKAETEAFRQQLYDWILNADAGADFRRRLRAAMDKVFGPDGSYGVFVRSDTNVEDLPGFTGAGLNLTVPNVVGFDNIAAAISRVWASPFTARAFAWRQSLMDQPEHVYPAVLLMLSVNADKSGVLVTQHIDTGAPGWLSVAVNEGVGGAVDGQAAESLRIDTATGKVRLLAQATAPIRRRVSETGGVDKIPVSGSDTVLQQNEIAALIRLAKELPTRFPAIVDADGKPAPADIEFGFLDGELRLFQIRPFLESARARGSEYLKSLDAGLATLADATVNLNDIPAEASQ